ncbi:MAG: hypothetical protein H7269_03285 [Cellulomonas sp.]|nr:hypothetical protein [Cellulomonas sp.]
MITFAPYVLGDTAGTLTVRSLGASTVTSLAGVGAWRLAVAATPTGTITSMPAGIDCGATCSGIFVSGVMLTFAPVPGQRVVSWSVPGCSGLTCQVPPTVPGLIATVEALPAQQVIVTRAGTGQGTVTSNPGGITCESICSGLFAGPVTLTSTPAPGSAFVGWSDPACGASSTCLLPAGTGTTSVVATFDVLPSRVLNVVIAGAAPGEVLAFQGAAVVGRCQGSCSMTVSSALDTVATADTANE